MRTPAQVLLVFIALGFGIIASVGVTEFMDSGGVPGTGATFGVSAGSGPPVAWPPELNQKYPDLPLKDLNGQPVQLSSYRGKVLFIEPIGLACRACQAFSGGHQAGGLFGLQPQAGLKNIHEYVRDFGNGADLDDDRILSIQILFYGPNSHSAPTPKEARQWATHFQSINPKTVVLLSDQSMINRDTRAMIPGFQLIDRDLVLRCDAGNPPRQDVYRELIPMIESLMDETR